MKNDSFKFLRHEPCPSCGSVDNVVVYKHILEDYETKSCMTGGCGYWYNGKTGKTGNVDSKPLKQKGEPLTSNDVQRLYQTLDPTLDKIVQQYGIRRTGQRVYFNYLTNTGAVRAIKCRNYEFPKTDKHHFFWEANGSNLHIFGVNTLDARDKNSIVITTGEYDAPAIRYMTGLNAVSTACGDKGAGNCVKENFSFFSQYEKVYVCTDADDSGKQAADAICGVLGYRAYRVTLHPYVVDDRVLKDARDYLIAGMADELRQAFDAATRQTSDYLVAGESCVSDVMQYYTARATVHAQWGISDLDETCPLQPHAYTVLMGNSGRGKSTLARYFLKQFVEQGVKVAWWSTEESFPRLFDKLTKVLYNEEVGVDEFGEFSHTKEEITELTMRLTSDVTFINADAQDGNISAPLESAIIEKDAKIIVIDHITRFFEMSSDRWQYPRGLVLQLVDVVNRYPVHIIVVSHTKTPQLVGKQLQSSPNPEEMTPPSQYDVLGGSALSQNAWNVLGFRRPYGSDVSYLWVLKARDGAPSSERSIRIHKETLFNYHAQTKRTQDTSNTNRRERNTIHVGAGQSHGSPVLRDVLPQGDTEREVLSDIPEETGSDWDEGRDRTEHDSTETGRGTGDDTSTSEIVGDVHTEVDDTRLLRPQNRILRGNEGSDGRLISIAPRNSATTTSVVTEQIRTHIRESTVEDTPAQIHIPRVCREPRHNLGGVQQETEVSSRKGSRFNFQW